MIFPESVVHMRIRYDDRERRRIAVSVGHNIFNPHCQVNVGLLLSRFGGGGTVAPVDAFSMPTGPPIT